MHLREQLCAQLREAVRSGQLLRGAKLPSTRVLARELGISRNTAAEAYEILCVEGWLEARTGSGTRVRAYVAAPEPPDFLAQAHFPARTLRFVDPDGTLCYLRF
jgi:GntR family transcriptional regulator/MocR family aminotransferase